MGWSLRELSTLQDNSKLFRKKNFFFSHQFSVLTALYMRSHWSTFSSTLGIVRFLNFHHLGIYLVESHCSLFLPLDDWWGRTCLHIFISHKCFIFWEMSTHSLYPLFYWLIVFSSFILVILWELWFAPLGIQVVRIVLIIIVTWCDFLPGYKTNACL